MKKLLALLALVLLLLIGGIAAGPFLAINGIRGAVEREDSAALARHVDFPAVRMNIRAQVDDYLVRRAGPDAQADVFGAFALRAAGAAAGGVVDLLATPAGIGAVLEGRSFVHRIIGGGVVPGDTYRHAPPRDLLEQATYRFESLSRFTATVPNRDGAPVVFVLTRQGVRWRVTDVQLPLQTLDPTFPTPGQ